MQVQPTSFTNALAISKSAEREANDRQLLKEMFEDRIGKVARIWKTGTYADRRGIDYAIRLVDGRRFTADIKTIHQGANVWWKAPHDPSLVLEISSNVERNIPGWAMKDSPYPDMLIWRFLDLPNELWPLAAQPLRKALRENLSLWTRKYGLRTNQAATDTGYYTGSFLCVPFSVVRAAYGDILMTMKPEDIFPTAYRHKGR